MSRFTWLDSTPHQKRKALICHSGKPWQMERVKTTPLFLALFLWALMDGHAHAQTCAKATSLPDLLACTHEAMAALPADKQDAVKPEFLETAGLVGDEAFVAAWAVRLDVPPRETAVVGEAYPDYGWQSARPLLVEGGAAHLIAVARSKTAPLRFGRAEALLAAGLRANGEKLGADEVARALASQDGLAAQLNDELLTLARSAREFEQGDLAYAAALLATHRCDLSRFEAAMSSVMAPEAIRYRFWRARLTGERNGLGSAIAEQGSNEDTRHVRQALEGIALLADLGPCEG